MIRKGYSSSSTVALQSKLTDKTNKCLSFNQISSAKEEEKKKEKKGKKKEKEKKKLLKDRIEAGFSFGLSRRIRTPN